MTKDHFEIWLRDHEQMDDANDLARALHRADIPSDGDPRIEALFRRATRGNGYYSVLLKAYSEPA